MVKIDKSYSGEQLPCSLMIDGYLKDNLDAAGKLIRDDWDTVGLYSGREGAGKTVKAMQDALYIDGEFNIDKIVFNARQFSEAMEKAKPYSVVMWDESDQIAGHTQSQAMRQLTRYFKRVRSKNVFIILVTPTFFDINKFFVMHRLLYVVQVYANKGTRGFFSFFNQEQLRRLYIDGKKYWNWHEGKPNFRGRFTKLPPGFPIDWKEYQKKKDLATREIMENEKTPKKIEMETRQKILKHLNDFLLFKYNKTWSTRDYAKALGISQSQVCVDLATIRNNVENDL